jgi:demethoxyubiquinone hydroxylase (CLK1/Coq7/Cat5 family)
MKGVRAKSDGNGGWDINLQREVLRKWGPAWLALLMLLGGLGSRLGAELWTLVVESRAIKEQILHHDKDIADGKRRDAELATQVEALRVEVRQDLREIKNEVRAIGRSLNKGG